jgi:hypothetical protein
MMNAQILAENMSIVAPDAVFDSYGMARVW